MNLKQCVCLLLLSASVVTAQCPYMAGKSTSGITSPHQSFSRAPFSAPIEPSAPLPDFSEVKKDIVAMLKSNQPEWPADDNYPKGRYYGPFFVRQAWHCSGSYRATDGHGGCDGGRQRFEPELSWDDNVNLDKAKKLLYPIKLKYGAGLSWGDLIIFAGNVAIEDMGGPVLGFCAGRTDDIDGGDSALLGPTAQQAQFAPCPHNGNCPAPLGTSQLGLIYVNPEGPMGRPNPAESAPQIRDIFSRMSMNDSETVALIGGGHAVGKSHGACVPAPGTFPSPAEDPAHPWPAGPCGGDKSKVVTSGFEGAWTNMPGKWGNDFFRNMLFGNWSVKMGPGGHYQWHVENPSPPMEDLMMLTSDLALIHDSAYKAEVKKFSDSEEELAFAFSHAWYKLTTSDMGPYSRCLQAPGTKLPPPQPFQYPLPAAPTAFPDWSAVRQMVRAAISTSRPFLQPDTDANGKPYYGAVFVELAWQCASTYRRTDYLGGCNGARLRFAPQSTWSTSVGLSDALKLLQPIQASFQGLSLSDLIVFAAQVAIEDASGLQLTFCPGRVDASEGGSAHLNAPLNDAATDANNQMVRQRLDLLNLSVREWVALSARMRSRTLMNLRGYGSNSWSTTGASVLSNQYFASMLKYNWVNDTSTGKFQYRASDSQTPIFITPADHNLIAAGQNDYAGVVQEYSFDNSAFLADFASAWQKLMNADRFDGPTRNLCSAPVTPAPLPETERPWFVALMTFISTLMLVGVMFLVIRKCHSSEMHTHLPVAQHDHLESDGRPLFSPI